MGSDPNAKPAPEKPKDGKKVFDVAKPGKTAAGASSRPIIVTNRPVLKDPMVVMEDGSSKPVVGPPDVPVKVRAELKLSPLNKSEATEPNTDEPAPREPKKVEISTPETETELPAKTQEPKTTAPSPESTPTVTEEAGSDEPARKDDQTLEVKAEPSTTTGSPLDIDDTETEDGKDKPGIAEQAKAAEAKKDEEHIAAIEKLVSEQKYYLPINSLEKRRTKRHLIIGILLIILLALAWTDVALDAGLVHIGNLHAITHLFTN
ncbi:MAG TPA: hypothetical protein VLG37_00105 [Candidatus Saccharimonadales bacterium]|nr:hypothetical protein [Candidatus Saccharimonadales bacterium]